MLDCTSGRSSPIRKSTSASKLILLKKEPEQQTGPMLLLVRYE